MGGKPSKGTPADKRISANKMPVPPKMPAKMQPKPKPKPMPGKGSKGK